MICLFFQGKAPNDFVTKRLTKDFTFEDPMGLYVGQSEFAELYKIVKASVSNLDFSIKGEYHGPHEIIMDWTMHLTMKPFGMKMDLPMRTNILLEPAEKGGQQEKIFR